MIVTVAMAIAAVMVPKYFTSVKAGALLVPVFSKKEMAKSLVPALYARADG